jgi:hypothetical protein
LVEIQTIHRSDLAANTVWAEDLRRVFPLKHGLVAICRLDPANPRILQPDQHLDEKKGHFASRAQGTPATGIVK